jgi:ParB family chromosome partitioning protein
MEIEFHQLELRYERLKVIRLEQERRLLSSLAEIGQQIPIVVVKEAAEGPFVVIDGYKRIRALRRLGRDTIAASCWPGKEAEALITARLMQTAEPGSALEESWLLDELHERFGFSLEELAQSFRPNEPQPATLSSSTLSPPLPCQRWDLSCDPETLVHWS